MGKIIGNTTTTPIPRSDWTQTDKTKADFIRHKPELGTISGKDIIEKSDLTTDIQSSLEEISSKANIVTVTTEEYEALTPEEINANTLYMITDEEDVWNVEVLISEDGLTLSLVDTTPINVIDAVDSGVNVRLYANISTDKIRYYSMNGRGTNSFGDYVDFVYGDSAEVDTIQISRNGRNTLIGRVVDEFASASDVVELKTKVGDITVSEQINNAVSQKSQVQIITWEADD